MHPSSSGTSARELHLLTWGIAIFAVVLSALSIYFTTATPLFSDEIFHYPQIEAFLRGNWSLHPSITTYPVYHAITALELRLFGAHSLAAARGLNFLNGLIVVALFYRIARTVSPESAALKSAQVWFLPILHPFFYFAFTDVLSLAVVLGGVLFLLRGRYHASALLFGIGSTIRQSNLVMLVYLACHILGRHLSEHEGGTTNAFPKLRGFIRESWSALALLSAGMGLMLFQNGIALGDRGAHRFGFHPGNLSFSLLLFAICFLPVCSSIIVRNRSHLLRPMVLGLLAVGYTVLVFGLHDLHPYNRYPGFLRNEILAAILDNGLPRQLYFIPVAVGLTALIFSVQESRYLRPFLPAAFLTLCGSALVEARYYIPLFVLFNAFRRTEALPIERITTALQIGLSVTLLIGMFRGGFAL